MAFKRPKSVRLLGKAQNMEQTPTTSEATSATTAAPMAKSHAPKHADVVEQRITDLHGQLSITDQQSKQWDAFTAVMRENANKTGQAYRERSQKLPTMNADDAMKSYAALTQQHAENMQKLSSAFSDLYAVLSPEQKKVADAMYRNEQAKKAAHHGSHKHSNSMTPASASSAG